METTGEEEIGVVAMTAEAVIATTAVVVEVVVAVIATDLEETKVQDNLI